jgi:hypothetical protein
MYPILNYMPETPKADVVISTGYIKGKAAKQSREQK